MGSFSIWHWLVVLAVVLLFFGAGRLPNVMGDLAKGIKNFKSGLREGERGDEAVDRTVAKPLPPERPDHAAARADLEKDETARS
jgi:sec-independent protein translocase protein TatA